MTITDHRAHYSIYGLLAAGMRLTDDYSEEDAIADYLEMHPEADPEAVRRELQEEIERHGG